MFSLSIILYIFKGCNPWKNLQFLIVTIFDNYFNHCRMKKLVTLMKYYSLLCKIENLKDDHLSHFTIDLKLFSHFSSSAISTHNILIPRDIQNVIFI